MKRLTTMSSPSPVANDTVLTEENEEDDESDEDENGRELISALVKKHLWVNKMKGENIYMYS